jgi:hypothetical protein
MSWGNSWSSGSAGSGWGNSGKDSDNNKEPEGQHISSCIAGAGPWGHNGLMSGCYDEHCSGCRHDRAGSTWSGSKSGINMAVKLAAFLGMGVATKKGIWD